MFQIAIDTDTMPVSPAVYADEYRGRALPTVLPLVQGFRGNLRVYFLGGHAPSENAAVALYLRALQSKEKLVQTGLGTRGVSDAGNVYYDVPLAADTTALSAVLGNRENVIMRAGIVANDVTASPQTNFEWQLNIAVSASAIGTGEKPPVSPNAIEEHNNDVAAHPFILQKIAAAEVDVSGLRTSIAGVSESLNATNTNLNNAKSELSTEISSVSASLSAEIIARENADAELRAALTEEQGARSDADSELRAALDAEASERSEAVSELGTKVSEEITVEANARENADDELRNAISEEATARAGVDTELRAALDAEASARSEAIEEERNALVNTATALQNSINNEIVQRSQKDAELSSRIVKEANCRLAEDAELIRHIGNLCVVTATESENIGEHISNALQHWKFCSENNLIVKDLSICQSEGIALVNNLTHSGIFLMPRWNYGCFAPMCNRLVFGDNGCISLSSGTGISLSTGSGRISLSTGSGRISLSSGMCSRLSISCGVSLCRSGGNVLQGNASETALYFGTTPFATSKIDEGIRVVCFANPLGKLNIKAGNGGRIDICATCVYVNGVKIST